MIMEKRWNDTYSTDILFIYVFQSHYRPLSQLPTMHWPSQCCYMAAKLGLLKQGTQAEYQQQR
jgi:hypothetical protein